MDSISRCLGHVVLGVGLPVSFMAGARELGGGAAAWMSWWALLGLLAGLLLAAGVAALLTLLQRSPRASSAWRTGGGPRSVPPGPRSSCARLAPSEDAGGS